MKLKTFDVPALYGDHHVTEVRRILLQVEGITEVYASSAFQIIEVTYDESMINDLEIAIMLDEAGYLGEWSVPIEMGSAPEQGNADKPFFRHTTTYETIKQTVSFAQRVSSDGRPLWRCPGIGAVKMDGEVQDA
jgi:copper chaperone CopZ